MLRWVAAICVRAALPETDLMLSRTCSQIQHTIQEEFADSLVITIAHRLSTVVGASPPSPLPIPSSSC